MQAREARERGEALEDMAALHVAFLLLAQTRGTGDKRELGE